jgi:hypothetical protein
MNKNRKHKKYDANFTAGGILFNEFIALKEILLSDNFENLIAVEEHENNIMGVATNAARKRIISEIKRRYNAAPEDFWIHFFEWNEYEQKLGLFYLCLKTYPLILDLHFEVTLKKYKVGSSLGAYDIQMRIDEIASVDEDVASWSDSTYKKINVQYRKALKDVGLCKGTRLIKEAKAKPAFWSYFEAQNESWFLAACFKN